jgi:CheY-like chemotaxis protein
MVKRIGLSCAQGAEGGLRVEMTIPYRSETNPMKVRTLIVDDELLARERLRQLLQDEPEIELVGECADGTEAVEAIQKQSPDLIFLDIQMPELDGFACCRP